MDTQNQEVAAMDVPVHFTADLPYPPVCAAGPNPVYARAMLDNVGGSSSEISAVSLYFYNHLVTSCQAELSRVFHEISIVEMHHLEIFGTLAYQLGMDPRLWTRQGRRFYWWTPGYNKYTGNTSDMLVNAIQSENAAIEKYTLQARQIADTNIVENLNRIILDEQLHVSLLTKLYEKYHCG